MGIICSGILRKDKAQKIVNIINKGRHAATVLLNNLRKRCPAIRSESQEGPLLGVPHTGVAVLQVFHWSPGCLHGCTES